MTRNDIHRPSASEFDPEAYDCFGVFDLFPEPGFGLAEIIAKREAVNAAVKMGYAFAAHQSGGQCGHCGAHIRYAALMLHPGSMEMIYIGETCLDNRFEALTAAQFHHLRQQAKLNKERKTARERFEANLAKAVEVEPSLAILGTEDYEKYSYFVSDVRSKLFKWELSEKQVAAVAKSIAKQDAWEAKKAEEAKTAKPVPVTDQRFVIVGEVVSVKEVSDNFNPYGGYIMKMTVRDERGFRVYGTRPSKLNVESGDRVKFEAKVKVSPDDETFGWFSRPTKAEQLVEMAIAC